MKRFCVEPPPVAGARYSPVVVSPETIAARAKRRSTFEKLISITAQLTRDQFTDYMAEIYARGLAVAGEDWGFMDLCSVIYAVAELGLPENYLEIGVRRGRSLCVLAAASPNTKIHAFDMWQVGYANNDNPGPDLVRNELSKYNCRSDVTFVDGDSHTTIPRYFAENPNLTFDVINVDGDHSVQGARDDLRNVVDRLRVGGVLIFDDIANPYCPGLDAVWDEFLKNNPSIAGYSYKELGAGVGFAVRMTAGPKRERRAPHFLHRLMASPSR